MGVAGASNSGHLQGNGRSAVRTELPFSCDVLEHYQGLLLGISHPEKFFSLNPIFLFHLECSGIPRAAG